jgi:hypothetical protein
MDFLTFKTFISQDALIVFYYMGAIFCPFFAWVLAKILIYKFDLIGSLHQKGKEFFWKTLSFKQKILVSFLMVFIFLLMQLFWRMMFEFLIAYMQIRDALV